MIRGHLQNGSGKDCHQADNSGNFGQTQAESGIAVRAVVGGRRAWKGPAGRGTG